MADPLKPNTDVLAKLGAILVHAEEALAPGGHEFDLFALKGLLMDPAVVEWREAMDKLALLPVKRDG